MHYAIVLACLSSIIKRLYLLFDSMSHKTCTMGKIRKSYKISPTNYQTYLQTIRVWNLNTPEMSPLGKGVLCFSRRPLLMFSCNRSQYILYCDSAYCIATEFCLLLSMAVERGCGIRNTCILEDKEGRFRNFTNFRGSLVNLTCGGN